MTRKAERAAAVERAWADLEQVMVESASTAARGSVAKARRQSGSGMVPENPRVDVNVHVTVTAVKA